MRVAIALIIAGAAIGGARCARSSASALRMADGDTVDAPYTPSVSLARFVSLGYREALADILYVRLRGYFGDYRGTTADAIASIAEAIVELDPRFRSIYRYAPTAITIAERGVDQSAVLRSLAILERGIREFPDDWQLQYLAGQMYIQDLKTDNPDQQRKWQERGLLLVESAIRKPDAPVQSATWAAALRTRLGQRERAVQGLREMLLVTPGGAARKRMIEALAKLENADSAAIASEIYEMRKKFETEWRRERRSVNASMYLLVGGRLQPGFDMTDLATGGRDLLMASEELEELEPPE